MTEPAAQPRLRRGMLGFYVAGFLLLALAVSGTWLWTAWDNWQFGEHEAKRRQAEAAPQYRRNIGVISVTVAGIVPHPSLDTPVPAANFVA